MSPDQHNFGSKITVISAHSSLKHGNNFELILNWYKTNSKSLAGEETLSNLHIQNLQEILGNPIWNHIYHCWQVEAKHVAEIQAYADHMLDTEKFMYFIEAYNIQKIT